MNNKKISIDGFKISGNLISKRIIDIYIDDETINKLIFPFLSFPN